MSWPQTKVFTRDISVLQQKQPQRILKIIARRFFETFRGAVGRQMARGSVRSPLRLGHQLCGGQLDVFGQFREFKGCKQTHRPLNHITPSIPLPRIVDEGWGVRAVDPLCYQTSWPFGGVRK